MSHVKCGPSIKRRNWRRIKDPLRLTRAERAMRFIEANCLVPEGALVGKPIKLAGFQEDFFYSVLDNPDGTRRAYLSIARKNSKTATIACLLLVFLIGPEAKQNSQIVSGARSREQAGQVYNYASKMVQQSPKLSRLVRIVPSGKRLVGLPLNVEYRALAAEGATSHGLSPLLAILDEVGQVRGPQDDFVDAITTSQGAHDAPLLIAISTQAANDADLFSVWLDDAERSKDPRIVSHLYATDKTRELDDPVGWKEANPAIGLFRSLDDVREMAAQAKRMPSAENTFRNLYLNQRVAVTSPFISADVWKANSGDPDPQALDDGPVYIGLDLSARNDLTALAMVAKCGDEWSARVEFFAPEVGLRDRAMRDRAPYDVWHDAGYLTTTPGASVDYSFVAQRLAEIAQEYDVVAVAYDRWRMDVMRNELARIGADDLPLVEFGQGFRDMSPALDVVEAELMQGRIRHGGNPLLTWCAANAIATRDAAGNRKLDKSKATGRIDGLVALVMAMGTAAGNQSAEVIIEQGFVEL